VGSVGELLVEKRRRALCYAFAEGRHFFPLFKSLGNARYIAGSFEFVYLTEKPFDFRKTGFSVLLQSPVELLFRPRLLAEALTYHANNQDQ
jgi:hypothetical protein